MPKYPCSSGSFLDMLGEEANEIGKERFKMIRFGHHPKGKAPGYRGPSARRNLHKEVGDFLAVLEHALSDGSLDYRLIEKDIRKKHVRLGDLFGLTRPKKFRVVIVERRDA